MKFVVETKELTNLLSIAGKLVEKITAVTLITIKNGIRIVIASPDYYFSSEMGASVEKAGKFSVTPEILNAILKSRIPEIEFYTKDNRLFFKSSQSRLQGKDITLLTDEEIRDPIKLKSSLLLPKKLQRKILMLLDACALTSFYGKSLAETIYTKDNKITVVCIDEACAAIGTLNTQDKIEIPLTDIPTAYSEKLKHIPGDDFSIGFNKDMFVVNSTIAHVELKQLQTDKVNSLKALLELEKAKVNCSFVMESSRLKTELDNLVISYEQGIPISITLKNRSLQFLYKTSSGIFTSETIVEDVHGQCSFNLDLEIFKNLLSRVNGKILIKVRETTVAMHYSFEKNIEVRFLISKLVTQEKPNGKQRKDSQ